MYHIYGNTAMYTITFGATDNTTSAQEALNEIVAAISNCRNTQFNDIWVEDPNGIKIYQADPQRAVNNWGHGLNVTLY